MIPGLDFRAFGYDTQGRARAVYDGIARRYAQLALAASKRGRIGVVAKHVAKGLERGGVKRGASAPGIARAAQPPRTRGDVAQEGRLRERARLAKVFTLAHERGAIDFALNLLNEGCSTRSIVVALYSMPNASRRRGGFAARLAARNALASAPPTSDSTPNDRVAALMAAYNKAGGAQP